MLPYLRLRLLAQPARGAAAGVSLHAPTLRRVLGKALIETHCPFGEPHCQPPATRSGPVAAAVDLCAVAGSCPYGVAFAASRSPRPPLALYVPEAPDDQGRHGFEITLLGEAWRSYPWILNAVRRALAVGVGRERLPWRLLGVARLGPQGRLRTLCTGDLEGLAPDLAPDHLAFDLDGPAPLPLTDSGHQAPGQVPPRGLAVQLLSPTRLVHDRRLLGAADPVPFAALVARLFDRLEGLTDGPSAEARERWEARAAGIPLLADETSWATVRDYSARSRREIRLDGKVGRLLYGPEALAFLPLLKVGETIHVGKNPAAGCGRLSVAPLSLGSLSQAAQPATGRRRVEAA